MNKKILAVGVIILVILGIGLGFKLGKAPNAPEQGIGQNQETNTGTPSDQFSSWKTYQNNELGFTFKYPAEWKMEQEGASMQSLGQKAFISLDNLSIAAWDNSTYSIDQLKQAPPGGIDPQTVRETTTTLGGFPAIEVSYYSVSDTRSGMNTRQVAASHNNLTYVIICKDKCEEIFSTFKFTK